jgi:hypothetical protein
MAHPLSLSQYTHASFRHPRESGDPAAFCRDEGIEKKKRHPRFRGDDGSLAA